MSELDELRALFRQSVQKADDARHQVMLTGRRVDANTVTMAGAAKDRVWVRSTDDSREQTQAWGQSVIANAHVRVRRNEAGELELVGPAYGSGIATGVQASVTLPMLDGKVQKATWYGHNFSPGRVRRSETGGLDVLVEGFVFNGVALPATDLTLTAPGTSGKQALCCVVYTPLTGAFSQVTGSNFDAGTPITDTEAYNSLTLAQGVVPLGGFLVANGATTLEGARWVDARTYVSARGPLHKYDATANPGVGDDSGDGYSVGSLWHNVTADTLYACLDATVGAAVWKLTTGAGITVKEVDGTPSVSSVTEIRVTNGTLTDVGGGVVEIATGGGGGGGGGVELNAETLIYDKTLATAAEFDTNVADDNGRTGLGGYTDLRIVLEVRAQRSTSGGQVLTTINADTTNANYQAALLFGGSSTPGAVRSDNRNLFDVASNGDDANVFTLAQLWLPSYAGTIMQKMIVAKSGYARQATLFNVVESSLRWENTAAITRLQWTVDDATTTFAANSRLRIYASKVQSIGGPATATVQTTNATATTLASVNVAAGEAVTVKAFVIGKKSDETAGAARELLIAARRTSAGNVTQIGVAHGTLVEDSAGTPAIDADVDTGTQTVRLRVTGIAAETWEWTGRYDVARSSV